MFGRHAATLLIILATVIGGPAEARKKRSKAEPARSDSATVRLVQVPVQVTAKGRPVRGLSAADFRLFEEGDERPILSVDVSDLAVSSVGADEEGTLQLPTVARRRFLLIFDLSFSEPASIQRARRAVQSWAQDALHPSDLVAVATYSIYSGPRLLLNFTDNREQVEVAVASLGAPERVERDRDPLGLRLGRMVLQRGEQSENTTLLDGTAPDTDEDLTRQGGRALNLSGGSAILQEQVDKMADQDRRQDIMAFTRSFEQLAELLQSVDGRKYVVYLSEGFDSSLVFASQDSNEIRRMSSMLERAGGMARVDGDRRFGSVPVQSRLTDMLDQFRRSDCTIHAVDVASLGGNRATLPARVDSLHLLAGETGGEVFRNFDSLGDAMRAVLDRTSVTYLLSFEPESLREDGAYRRLKVKLKHAPKGARVTYRPGYYAPLPYKEMAPHARMLQTAQLLFSEGSEAASSIGAELLALPFEHASEAARVPFVLELDGLGLTKGQRGPLLTTEIFAYAFDRSGAIADFVVQTVQVDLERAKEALGRSGLKFYGEFALPAGDYRLRVLARNRDSGAFGVDRADLQIPEFTPGMAQLYPVFPEPRGKWVLAREAAVDTGAFPFVVNGEPYLPAADVGVGEGDSARLYVVGYSVDPGATHLPGRILDAGGNLAAAVDLDIVERLPCAPNASYETLVTELDCYGLAPGEYTLELSCGPSCAARPTPLRVSRRP